MTAETNAERLENMLPIGYDEDGNYLIKNEDWHWLQSQAERARQLEQQNKTMRHRILNVCNNVGAFPKATVKDYVQGVFKDYLPQEDSQ